MMQAIEKSKTKKFLSYYALPKIHLHKHKSYFKFILLLSGDINLDPGPNANVLPFSNESFCNDESQIFSGSDDSDYPLFHSQSLYLSLYILYIADDAERHYNIIHVYANLPPLVRTAI